MSDWRHEAACLTEDPELFFPVGDTSHGPAMWQAEEAMAVCLRCPVRAECLQWALTTDQDAGIWGGMLEEERRALRRRISRGRRKSDAEGNAEAELAAALEATARSHDRGPMVDPEPVREIILAGASRGLSVREIARQMDMTESTVRSIREGKRRSVTQATVTRAQESTLARMVTV